MSDGPEQVVTTGGDDGGTSADPALRRVMTAKQLASRLGRTDRVIGNWIKGIGCGEAGPCPHETRASGGRGGKKGGVRAFFNEQEVRAWLARRGVAETTERSGPRERVGDRVAEMPLLRWAENHAMAESLDFANVARRMLGTMQEVLSRRPDESASPQTVRQWADAVKVLSGEARQLQSALEEAEEREERVIARATAASIIRAFGTTFTTQLSTLPMRAAQRARERAADLAACGDGEPRAALIGAMVRDIADETLGLVADQLERDAERLEGGPSAPAPGMERAA